jgi:hypothetical protein
LDVSQASWSVLHQMLKFCNFQIKLGMKEECNQIHQYHKERFA